MGYINKKYKPTANDLIAEFTFSSKQNKEYVAENLAAESSTGTWTHLTTDMKRANKICAKAFEIKKNRIGKDYAFFSRYLNEEIYNRPNYEKWKEIYNKICEWDIKIDELNEESLKQTHFLEKLNANKEFAKYVKNSYKKWLHTDDNRPVLSYDVISEYLIPQLENTQNPIYFIVLDCMRLDQFKVILPYLHELFDMEENMYYSILPTATPYSRNSIFSGILPLDIEKNFPQFWTDPFEEETSRNRNEHQLMEYHLKDMGFDNLKTSYVKIFNIEEGNYVIRKIPSWKNNDVVILVYNFLDLLAHHRSKSSILQETIPDDSALRAFTKHWFLHSSLYEALKLIKETDATIILTTDHGSILGKKASLVHGNRDTSTNLRYKFGENINGDSKQILFIRKPTEFKLPAESPSKNYILAKENYYFVYPTKFHEYEKQYHGTFQHGGISLEEMVIPCITLTPK